MYNDGVANKFAQELFVGPNVRQMPGSDVISLELNIKGMTEPNKHIEQEEESLDDITEASSVPT